MSAEETKAAETVQVKITSKNGHRHAGEKHKQDAVISVAPHDAKIIVETLKVGELVKGK